MSKLFSFGLFFSSFLPLWISIAAVDIINLHNEEIHTYTELISLFVIIILLVVSLIILWFALRIPKKYKGENTIKYTITEISEEKSITSEYLLSYILPLFAFDFTHWKDVVLFLIYFGFLAFLCIRHSHFSVNIVLELCGYRFYNSNLLSTDKVGVTYMVVSRRKLNSSKGQEIYIRPIDQEHVLDVHFSMK